MDVEHVRKALLMAKWLQSQHFGEYIKQRLEGVRSASVGEPDYIAKDEFDGVEVEGIESALDKEIMAKLHMVYKLGFKEHNTAGMRRVVMASLWSPMKKSEQEHGKDMHKHLMVHSCQTQLTVLEALQIGPYWIDLWGSYISRTQV